MRQATGSVEASPTVVRACAPLAGATAALALVVAARAGWLALSAFLSDEPPALDGLEYVASASLGAWAAAAVALAMGGMALRTRRPRLALGLIAVGLLLVITPATVPLR